MTELTADRLKSLLHYDEATGLFTLRYSRGGMRAGDVAGTTTEQGYAKIKIGPKQYLAHRLAWLYVHGIWPSQYLDHIDGDRLNNKIANLRCASPAINQQNQRSPQRHNKSGFLGVYKRRNKWRANISIDGKQTNLGTFSTPELAHDAYLKAKRAHHSGCTI